MAKPYARAIFELARAEHALDKIRDELEALAALMRESPVVARLMLHPLIPSDRRVAALRAAFEPRLCPQTLGLLLLLEEKNRLGALTEVWRAYDHLYKEHQGILGVKLTSANPLTDEQVAAIKEKLQQRFNKTIEPTLSTDPSLLGGFRVKIGDAVLDSSLSTQLERFRSQLIHA